MSSFLRFKTAVIFSVLFSAACAPMIDTHGDVLDPDDMAALKIGVTPYTEVQKILGSPSSKTIFDSENWIYIHSKQERMAFFKPVETERTVVVLKFSNDGILQGIETKDLKDGFAITPSTATTIQDQNSMSVLDQLLGNVGKFQTETPVH